MANIAISIEGIDQAIENLKYRPDSVKQKAISAIRSFYDSEDAIKVLTDVDTDILIRKIWDTGDDPSKIKSKRRNFFSLKSSINTDLKKLSEKDMNLDNITISDANIFDMTEEAKNNLLNSFTNAVKTGDIDLEKATGILKAVTDFLETLQIDTPDNESLDLIKEIKKILSKISQTALAGEEVAEEIELAEDEGLEVVAADEALEILDEADEDTEVIELAEDEELEEIELPEDADLEEIEEGEPEPEESIADDIIEELDDDTEVVAEDDPIELEADEELEILDGADEDTEVIELAEDEELEEIELPEGEDLEEVEPLEDEEL
ncbi:MAG: hypothetical protein KJ658_01655, partial [Proteobacteria bacterium]|nr:hypothetical protein [Pseudomonadota bacterium]